MARDSEKPSDQARPMNDANAALRVADALRLRRMGFIYADIAQRVGYKDESGARKAVKKELNKLIHQEAQELVEHTTRLQLDRLDYALEKAVMPGLEAGDLEAARTLVLLLKHQAELLGLYPKPDETGNKGIIREYFGLDPQTVISNGHTPQAV